jgi:flagellar L-ring protein precursor FlgH
MRNFVRFLAFLVLSGSLPDTLLAQSNLWDRRDINTATMFHDYRARRIGDILTIVIEETTGSDNQESRNMGKKTTAGTTASGTGSTSGGPLALVLQSFGYNVDLESTSQRTFNGTNATSIDRKFTDKMSFIVVDVLPNGNLIVQGSRQRMITRELRTLHVQGIVRPADIGPNNTVLSQFVADLRFAYEGKGPESRYTNQNYGGRLWNILWPY